MSEHGRRLAFGVCAAFICGCLLAFVLVGAESSSSPLPSAPIVLPSVGSGRAPVPPGARRAALAYARRVAAAHGGTVLGLRLDDDAASQELELVATFGGGVGGEVKMVLDGRGGRWRVVTSR